MKLTEQIHRNLLAIISLVVAITALSYGTVRNEITEDNRTIRYAGFELLQELNSLQLLIDYAHFDQNEKKGNPISGWGHVMYIRDMSHLVSPDVTLSASRLSELWGQEWRDVSDNAQSNKRVTDAINQLRDLVRVTMVELR